MTEKNVVSIYLPVEVLNYLEEMDYRINGLKVLHTHALDAGVPVEKVEEIRREFQEAFATYQVAKHEMWAQYSEQYRDCKRWWVDFQEGVLHIAQ